MDYVIRAVRAEEWPLARELRLAALQDPVAPVAFLETYESAVAQPDDFWQERTATGATGTRVRQFIAEAPDGTWVGSVTLLVELPADEVRFGAPAEVNQGHLVGVFVRPEVRGTGVTDALFRAAVEWAWSLSEPRLERVRLYVHESNLRAAAFYRRFGFVPSGQTVRLPGDTGDTGETGDVGNVGGTGDAGAPEWELEYVLGRE
ncbi:GNAT family N-acetyltransferase [Streptomyces sp. NBC_01433]|uniref:GNAT family N-acetyltransferase n=1 Tax=Streptomyces sp. NBC_01433 TaxID=2903864 RepID=UPI002259DDAE|nr:GNAT family N-acetyltransferase [Streptomyces sp. NBC_01433]MCX4675473.1 GNAT family N-acetyltransferase [Streptomyces sp. NBC_01433]